MMILMQLIFKQVFSSTKFQSWKSLIFGTRVTLILLYSFKTTYYLLHIFHMVFFFILVSNPLQDISIQEITSYIIFLLNYCRYMAHDVDLFQNNGVNVKTRFEKGDGDIFLSSFYINFIYTYNILMILHEDLPRH